MSRYVVVKPHFISCIIYMSISCEAHSHSVSCLISFPVSLRNSFLHLCWCLPFHYEPTHYLLVDFLLRLLISIGQKSLTCGNMYFLCRMNIPANTFQPRARPLFQYRHYRYSLVSLNVLCILQECCRCAFIRSVLHHCN
jgi:hypothetical protein